MLNNKGQSLVLFVIVLPILIFLLILVIDIGKIIVLKQELNNISELVLDYGLDNFDSENIENELVNLIKLNKNDVDNINVYIEDDKIYVKLSEKCDGIFSLFIDLSIFNVNSFYMGSIIDDEKRIERMGD